MIGVSEEVRNRCHVKHLIPRYASDTMAQENFINENISNSNQQGSTSVVNSTSAGVNRRQKSWDLLDQSAIAQARQHKQPPPHQVNISDSFGETKNEYKSTSHLINSFTYKFSRKMTYIAYI